MKIEPTIPVGRLSTSAYGNGVTTTWTYRDDGSTKRDNQVASIDIAKGANTIDSFAYTYDENKNVTAETRGGVMSGYGWTTDNAGSPGFDADDRLTYWKRSDNNLTQNWTLSLVGDWNAFASQGTSQTRAHGPTHELTSVTVGNDTDTVQHDVKGNVTFIPAVLSAIGSDLALSWDFDNRLVGANTDGQPGHEVTFQYDAQGRRVSKTVNGSTTVFVHAGQQIMADYPSGAAATSPREKYVYASYIDEPILKDGTLPGGTGLVYYHHDRRYTITALTDSTGSAVERNAYSPYGSLTILDGSGSAIASSQTANRYTYTGREHDPETNLYHFRARYYSPSLGRFLNRDPLGFVDGMSLYRAYFVPGGFDPFGMMFAAQTQAVSNDFSGNKDCYEDCRIWARAQKELGKDYWQSLVECTHRCKDPTSFPPVDGCVLQVCCKPVAGIFRRAHCVIRFVHQGLVEGCRGGPTRRSSTDNGQPSFCKGCCGPYGTITTACGKGSFQSDDPAETGLAADLADAAKNPGRCTTVKVSLAQCLTIKKCVFKEMATIESKCYRYAPGGHNSNSTWRTALRNCLGGTALPDPPGLQPGTGFLQDNDISRCDK